MRKEGVLVVGSFLSGTGAHSFSVCEELASRLSAAGWPVLRTSAQRGRVRRLCDMVWTVWARKQDYRVAQVDVFSGLAFIWAEVVCLNLRCLGKPFVLTLHGGNLPVFAKSRNRRVKRLLQSAFAVTVPSRYLFDQMRPYCDKLGVLPNALDLGRYLFRVRERPEAKLLWLRAFSDEYNPSLAPQVLSLVKERYPDASLVMVGPDKGDGSIERARRVAEDLGVSASLEIRGAVEKSRVPSVLDECDVFLNTTHVDNTPVSVLEAMASGLPVVSTRVGGIPYLIECGHTGLLVQPDDAHAMAAAVFSILSEAGLAARLGKGARRVAEGCNWPNVLDQWERLLGSAAGWGLAGDGCATA